MMPTTIFIVLMIGGEDVTKDDCAMLEEMNFRSKNSSKDDRAKLRVEEQENPVERMTWQNRSPD